VSDWRKKAGETIAKKRAEGSFEEKEENRN
jgi:hypothetical protein